jgi:hypothetical protein
VFCAQKAFVGDCPCWGDNGWLLLAGVAVFGDIVECEVLGEANFIYKTSDYSTTAE